VNEYYETPRPQEQGGEAFFFGILFSLSKQAFNGPTTLAAPFIVHSLLSSCPRLGGVAERQPPSFVPRLSAPRSMLSLLSRTAGKTNENWVGRPLP
jgi:hypothetical protein